jgi:hypothetical protein
MASHKAENSIDNLDGRCKRETAGAREAVEVGLAVAAFAGASRT